MNILEFLSGSESDSRRRRPFVISGPCSAESREQVMGTAAALKKEGVNVFRAGAWKPRSKPGGFEGKGVEALPWLSEVRSAFGMKAGTEVANPCHMEEVLRHGLDFVWIGARTVTNPFAVQEIAESLKGVDFPVFIKNPVSPDLGLWIGAIERIANSGVSKIGAVHRGFNSFAKSAYRNNPYWSIPIELRHKMPGIPVLCDPSHIAGDRNLVETISLQAANLGFDGLFVESHINPDAALSDSFQQITPSFLGKIIYRIKEMNEIAEGDADMMSYRSEIDSIDDQIAGLLSRRMKISEEIGHYKKSHSIPVVQHERYASVLDKWVERGQAAGLDPVFMKELMRCIHEESVKVQMKIIENK